MTVETAPNKAYAPCPREAPRISNRFYQSGNRPVFKLRLPLAARLATTGQLRGHPKIRLMPKEAHRSLEQDMILLCRG
jgi:hypothetical protein